LVGAQSGGSLTGQLLPFEIATEMSIERPLAPGAVRDLDACRAIGGEAAAVLPWRHRLRLIARQQAQAHKPAQPPPAHAYLHVTMALA
jgi:hypothetical protein